MHLLTGPNGAGKSTLVTRVLQPVTGLPFVNADLIAAREWPDAEAEHAYDASHLAAPNRDELIADGASFITETVFSHQSKVDLVRTAHDVGYLVHLHVIVMPANLCAARVAERVLNGGHSAPEEKIRQRHERLWSSRRATSPSGRRSTTTPEPATHSEWSLSTSKVSLLAPRPGRCGHQKH